MVVNRCEMRNTEEGKLQLKEALAVNATSVLFHEEFAFALLGGGRGGTAVAQGPQEVEAKTTPVPAKNRWR